MELFLDNLYDVLFHPGPVLRQVAVAKPCGQAAAVALLATIIPAGAVYFSAAAGFVWLLPVAAIMVSLLAWFVEAAVFNLIAECYGGNGSALGLLTAMGFAYFPRVLVAPAWVIAAFLPHGPAAVFLGLTTAGVLGWVLVLDLIAIKETHGLSLARAVLVLITPAVICVAGLIVAMTVIGTSFLAAWPW